MKATPISDLRSKSVPELEALALQARADLYKTRRDLVFRRVTDTASMKMQRHNIARILTIINEKKRGSE